MVFGKLRRGSFLEVHFYHGHVRPVSRLETYILATSVSSAHQVQNA